MPQEKLITLSKEFNNAKYAVRANVSRQIDNEFLKLTAELRKQAEKPEFETDVTQNSLMDFFIERMVLTPKLTKEIISDMDTKEIEALYYAIVDLTQYENGDFLGLLEDMNIDLDNDLNDKKIMQRKAIEYQKRKINDIKKKHTVQ